MGSTSRSPVYILATALTNGRHITDTRTLITTGAAAATALSVCGRCWPGGPEDEDNYKRLVRPPIYLKSAIIDIISPWGAQQRLKCKSADRAKTIGRNRAAIFLVLFFGECVLQGRKEVVDFLNYLSFAKAFPLCQYGHLDCKSTKQSNKQSLLPQPPNIAADSGDEFMALCSIMMSLNWNTNCNSYSYKTRREFDCINRFELDQSSAVKESLATLLRRNFLR